MGVDYSSVVVFGSPITEAVYDRLYDLLDEEAVDEYLWLTDEWSGTGPFFGVRGPEVAPGEHVHLTGEVVPAAEVEAFADVVRSVNVPAGKMDYYLVNRVW